MICPPKVRQNEVNPKSWTKNLIKLLVNEFCRSSVFGRRNAIIFFEITAKLKCGVITLKVYSHFIPDTQEQAMDALSMIIGQ